MVKRLVGAEESTYLLRGLLLKVVPLHKISPGFCPGGIHFKAVNLT
jgi:hypothetical protein